MQQLLESALAPSYSSRRCTCGYSGATPLRYPNVEYPKVLVRQLLRFNNSCNKIQSRNDLVTRLRVGGIEGRAYKLSGVIEHIGKELYQGHYISYFLDNNVWYKINDDREVDHTHKRSPKPSTACALTQRHAPTRPPPKQHKRAG